MAASLHPQGMTRAGFRGCQAAGMSPFSAQSPPPPNRWTEGTASSVLAEKWPRVLPTQFGHRRRWLQSQAMLQELPSETMMFESIL